VTIADSKDKSVFISVPITYMERKLDLHYVHEMRNYVKEMSGTLLKMLLEKSLQ
jgi:hypothetical protein